METHIINQWQSYYSLNDDYGVIVDFLRGTISDPLNTSPIEKVFEPELTEKEQNLANVLQTWTNNTLFLTLIPSYKCNMECQYCYEGQTTKNAASLKIANVKPIVEAIYELYESNNYKAVKINLLGGEPLLGEHEPFYDDFFRLFYD